MLHNETKLKSTYNPGDHVINPDKEQTFDNEPKLYQITAVMNLDLDQKKILFFGYSSQIDLELLSSFMLWYFERFMHFHFIIAFGPEVETQSRIK